MVTPFGIVSRRTLPDLGQIRESFVAIEHRQGRIELTGTDQLSAGYERTLAAVDFLRFRGTLRVCGRNSLQLCGCADFDGSLTALGMTAERCNDRAPVSGEV